MAESPVRAGFRQLRQHIAMGYSVAPICRQLHKPRIRKR
jgi:hypothetical protein